MQYSHLPSKLPPTVGAHGAPQTAISVLFLDIDGVCNSDQWYDQFLAAGNPIPRPPLDREAVARLDRIIRATGAWIVLSTSWRGYPELPRWLMEHGCSGAVVGCTPRLDYRPRGHEIAAWLNQQAKRGVPIRRCCILDDGFDFDGVRQWLVRTDPKYGLQDDGVARAITLLGGGS